MKPKILIIAALLILVVACVWYFVKERTPEQELMSQVDTDMTVLSPPELPEPGVEEGEDLPSPLLDESKSSSPERLPEKGEASRGGTSRVTTDGAQSSTRPQAAVKRSGQEGASTASVAPRVLVYYFHGTTRCATCRKLQAFSSEAVREAFSEELRRGQLKWQILNIDEPENEHFVDDYQLYTRSLVVAKVVDGTQAEWKNLERIWELVGDKEAFMKYVQDEIRAYLGAES